MYLKKYFFFHKFSFPASVFKALKILIFLYNPILVDVENITAYIPCVKIIKLTQKPLGENFSAFRKFNKLFLTKKQP